jgi:hypothetical protein
MSHNYHTQVGKQNNVLNEIASNNKLLQQPQLSQQSHPSYPHNFPQMPNTSEIPAAFLKGTPVRQNIAPTSQSPNQIPTQIPNQIPNQIPMQFPPHQINPGQYPNTYAANFGDPRMDPRIDPRTDSRTDSRMDPRMDQRMDPRMRESVMGSPDSIRPVHTAGHHGGSIIEGQQTARESSGPEEEIELSESNGTRGQNIVDNKSDPRMFYPKNGDPNEMQPTINHPGPCPPEESSKKSILKHPKSNQHPNQHPNQHYLPSSNSDPAKNITKNIKALTNERNENTVNYILIPILLLIMFIILVSPKLSVFLSKYIGSVSDTKGYLIRAGILSIAYVIFKYSSTYMV